MKRFVFTVIQPATLVLIVSFWAVTTILYFEVIAKLETKLALALCVVELGQYRTRRDPRQRRAERSQCAKVSSSSNRETVPAR
jgi:hypothetical protein